MGLLDDIKQKAASIENENKALAEKKAQDQRYYKTSIAPVMKAAQEYFFELVAGLNVAAPSLDFAAPLLVASNEPVAMVQSGYKVVTDSKETPTRIDIRARCDMREPVTVRVVGKVPVTNQTERLDKYAVKYDFKHELDAKHEVCGGTFTINGPMNAIIRLQVDIEERCIYLISKNLPQPNPERIKLSPQACNEQAFERMGRLLLREIDSFLEQQHVSEEIRERLRREVEQNKQAEQAELARLAAEAAEEKRLAEEEARLVNRLKKHSNAGISKLQGLFNKD